ncbi:uncharacterized protein YbaP (TraB family) [Novosphingobium chloroacetimidivorans]|uniref:Uncharacterized protein YbaP (TraB family) n=1 Tax=Novosphingobium chloroacetimidivorans TaxID=1428314 RepID=A0A7W7K6B3_9SPHN|nr:TraB/GumN family protein [Novosphingobium chloroacetimidivorans]MBB4856725.1 uncharacterized protein YbaP (TraB family) [Novosphingobium chloroacetimidivorans]
MISLRRSPLALLAPVLLLLTPACGSAKEAPASKAAASSQVARPALWKVSDEDTTIWLFGTIHILPAGIEWYSGPIAKALEGSDALVTEIVEPNDPEVQAKIARIALADPPRNLRERLSPEMRRQYEAALASLQLPPSAFDVNDPWYAAVALSTLPLMKDGFGTMNGAEALLIERAKGKQHLGLETAEMQLGLFDGLPQDMQVKYLGEVLESFPKVRNEVKAMVEAWKTGKADELARLMNEEESDPQLMKILLVDRNKAWAKWIAERLKQPGTAFVAVGAGHLAGKDSVQAQLAAAAIKTTRVR